MCNDDEIVRSQLFRPIAFVGGQRPLHDVSVVVAAHRMHRPDPLRTMHDIAMLDQFFGHSSKPIDADEALRAVAERRKTTARRVQNADDVVRPSRQRAGVDEGPRERLARDVRGQRKVLQPVIDVDAGESLTRRSSAARSLAGVEQMQLETSPIAVYVAKELSEREPGNTSADDGDAFRGMSVTHRVARARSDE